MASINLETMLDELKNGGYDPQTALEVYKDGDAEARKSPAAQIALLDIGVKLEDLDGSALDNTDVLNRAFEIAEAGVSAEGSAATEQAYGTFANYLQNNENVQMVAFSRGLPIDRMTDTAKDNDKLISYGIEHSRSADIAKQIYDASSSRLQKSPAIQELTFKAGVSILDLDKSARANKSLVISALDNCTSPGLASKIYAMSANSVKGSSDTQIHALDAGVSLNSLDRSAFSDQDVVSHAFDAAEARGDSTSARDTFKAFSNEAQNSPVVQNVAYDRGVPLADMPDSAKDNKDLIMKGIGKSVSADAAKQWYDFSSEKLQASPDVQKNALDKGVSILDLHPSALENKDLVISSLQGKYDPETVEKIFDAVTKVPDSKLVKDPDVQIAFLEAGISLDRLDSSAYENKDVVSRAFEIEEPKYMGGAVDSPAEAVFNALKPAAQDSPVVQEVAFEKGMPIERMPKSAFGNVDLISSGLSKCSSPAEAAKLYGLAAENVQKNPTVQQIAYDKGMSILDMHPSALENKVLVVDTLKSGVSQETAKELYGKLPSDLKADRDVSLPAALAGVSLSDLDPKALSDDNVVSAYFNYCIDHSQKDRGTAAMEAYGALDEKTQDLETVQFAAANHGVPLEAMRDSAKDRIDVVHECVERCGGNQLLHASDSIQNDPKEVIHALDNGLTLADTTDKMQDNVDVVMHEVLKDPKSFADASERVRGIDKVAVPAVKEYPSNFLLLPDESKHNRGYVHLAGLDRIETARDLILANPELYRYAARVVQSDVSLIKEILPKNGMLLEAVPHDQRNQTEIAALGVSADWRSIRFLDTKTWHDPTVHGIFMEKSGAKRDLEKYRYFDKAVDYARGNKGVTIEDVKKDLESAKSKMSYGAFEKKMQNTHLAVMDHYAGRPGDDVNRRLAELVVVGADISHVTKEGLFHDIFAGGRIGKIFKAVFTAAVIAVGVFASVHMRGDLEKKIADFRPAVTADYHVEAVDNDGPKVDYTGHDNEYTETGSFEAAVDSGADSFLGCDNETWVALAKAQGVMQESTGSDAANDNDESQIETKEQDKLNDLERQGSSVDSGIE